MPEILYGQYQPSSINLERSTNLDSVRITEDGVIRITDDIIFNSGIGSILTDPTRILFSVITYYKVNGVWKEFEIFVKNNGIWERPMTVHKKLNSIWKRVY